MNWKRLLNPWAIIRELEDRNLILEDRCSEYHDRAYEAEDRAFHRASEHYYQRSRHIEAQNAHLLKSMTDMHAMTPLSITVPADFFKGDKSQ